jgi:hypothetical protein
MPTASGAVLLGNTPGRRGWCHTSAHDKHGLRPVARPASNAPPVKGEQVRDTWFWPPRTRIIYNVEGYDARQVDDLLRRVAAELDVGRPAGPLIENATLQERRWGRRYDIDAVDWFLGQFLLPSGRIGLAGLSADPWGDLPVAQLAPGGISGPAKLHGVEKPSRKASRAYFAERCNNAWRDFGQQPGTHLRVGGKLRDELRTAEQQTLASGGVWHVRAGGRKFKVTSRARPHETPPKTWSNPSLTRWEGVVDEAGMPILYTSGINFRCRASASIMFPDQRWLRFLVRGTRKANAIMTAVDEAGNRVARYRTIHHRGSKSVEIIVHPDWKLTDELALALAISARWLESYFATGGG